MALQTVNKPSTMEGTQREEEFMELFFTKIAQTLYDKAREAAEKERDTCKQQNSIWPHLTNALAQLAAAEKSYMSLLFLAPKGFLRKESTLKSSYESLRMECRRTEELQLTNTSDILHAHLLGQLAFFAMARLDLVEFYEKLSSQSSLRTPVLEDLLPLLRAICDRYTNRFHHPTLTPLKTAFTLEGEILTHLLEANVEMGLWNYLPSLLKIHEANAKLEMWGRAIQGKENRRLGLFKAPQWPLLFQWLLKLKSSSVSKFSLYFHEVLLRHSTPQDMKALTAKQSIDYVHLIHAFQRKTDARLITLILETNGLESYRGPGYVHPSKPWEPPKGLDSYPAIFSYPDKGTAFWPSLIMILADRTPDSSNCDRLTYVYDKKTDRTYYVQRIEARISLAVIFESKKTEKDSYITNFLLDLSQQLRGSRAFSSLKPGSK